MSDLKNWSASAGGNTSAAPDGFPEGMPPSGVNDAARETMAGIRRWYNDAEWKDLGDTPSYSTASIFTISGDYASTYHAGRRIKAFDGGATFYGTIASSTYTSNTRVSVTLASGNLTSSLSSIAVSILSFDNDSLPRGRFAELSATQTFAAPVTFGVAVTHSATASFGSRAAFNAGIDVSGTANLTESVIIGKTLTVDGRLDVSGTASFSNPVKFGDTVSFSASPAISDFTNSQHDHTSAGAGGTLSGVSVLVQQVNTKTGAVNTGTTTIPRDDSIPQNTEGNEYMTLAITPTNAGNTLCIDVVGHFSNSVGGSILIMALFKNSIADAIAVSAKRIAASSDASPLIIRYELVAGGVSEITFKIRAGGKDAGTTTFNGTSGAREYGGVFFSSMTITELEAP